MKKELETFAAMNPYPHGSAEGWGASAEGQHTKEMAMSSTLEGVAEPVSGSTKAIGPWAIGVAAAAVTLAIFSPLLLRGDPPGPVGAPVPPPTTTTAEGLQQPGTLSTEFLAYLLPISGEEVATVNYIRSAGLQERLDRVASCLESEGFDLDFQSSIPTDFVMHVRNYILPYDSLRKYGFLPVWTNRPPGFPPGEAYVHSLNDALQGLSPLPEDVNRAEASAMVDAYQNCASDADGAGEEDNRDPLSTFDSDHSTLAENFGLLVVGLDETNPEIVAALGDLRTCLEGHGWSFSTTRDDGSEILDPIGPFLGAVQSAVLAIEEEVERHEADVDAVTDLIQCVEPLEGIRRPLRVALREAYIDDNWAALLEAQTRFSAALAELGVAPQD